jgi:hypothetical protein
MSGRRPGGSDSPADDRAGGTLGDRNPWTIPIVGVTVDSDRRRRLLLAVGASALAVAVVVALVPAVPVPSSVASAFGYRWLALMTAVAGIVVAIGRVTSFGQTEGGPGAAGDWTPARPPERAVVDDRRTAGADVDDALERLAERGVADREQVSQRWQVRKRVREAAEAVLRAEGYDERATDEALARGTWTDDPRAAAFLGEGVRPSIATRVRDWASGDAFGRRARAAVDAVLGRAAAANVVPGDRDDRRRPIPGDGHGRGAADGTGYVNFAAAVEAVETDGTDPDTPDTPDRTTATATEVTDR